MGNTNKKKCKKAILKQQEECICRIKNNNGEGTGFFCTIPNDQNEQINILITTNHIINTKIIKESDNIIISLNNEKEKKTINIDENRKIYISEKYDVSIIEIKEEDNINKFIELDKDIFDYNNRKINENIYIIQSPKLVNSVKKSSVSYGIITNIQDEYNIIHKCDTESGPSGAPILKFQIIK